MDQRRMKPVPMLFPAMGSVRETEIRRVELDEARATRSSGKDVLS